MSILEIVLMVLIGLGVVIWAIILIVKTINRKKKPEKEDVEEIEIK